MCGLRPPSGEHLDSTFKEVGAVLCEADHVEERPSGFDVHENIDVTVGPIVATRDRARTQGHYRRRDGPRVRESHRDARADGRSSRDHNGAWPAGVSMNQKRSCLGSEGGGRGTLVRAFYRFVLTDLRHVP